MSNISVGLREALQIARTYGAGRGNRWRIPTGEEVRQIRAAVGLSQAQFASCYGIGLKNLKNWEQGRASPDQANALILHMIQTDGDEVAKIVGEVRKHSDFVDA